MGELYAVFMDTLRPRSILKEVLTMSNRKIETITREILGALKTSIQDRINIGKLLNEAREKFKEDKEFGKWRSDNLSDQIDKKTAYRYMQLAKCFSENLPENIPLSGLYELSADKNDSYRDAALEFLTDEGEASVKDVSDAIGRAKSILAETSMLDDVLSKVNDMTERDSYEVFLKIINHVGITKVQDWLEIDVLDQEKAA